MTENIRKIFQAYHNSITQAIKPYADFNKEVSRVFKHYTEYQLGLVKSLTSTIEQYQEILRISSEAFTFQINLWGKWVEQNRILFDSYTGYWQRFQKQYKITEQEAIGILKKYKWFMTPSLPMNFVFEVVKIGKRKGNQRKAMNRLFIGFFSSKNYEELETLVDEWETNNIFKPRIKIFRDCVNAIKSSKRNNNPSNVVLPTLIAQIDGIQTKFMQEKGLAIDLKKGKWKDIKGNVVDKKVWFKDLTSNQEMLGLANDIFLNILFQKAQTGKPLKTPFVFNRHKIMHGEYLKYGRIDNTIRAFLILDFLATISS